MRFGMVVAIGFFLRELGDMLIGENYHAEPEQQYATIRVESEWAICLFVLKSNPSLWLQIRVGQRYERIKEQLQEVLTSVYEKVR